jgi:hypothetical protein
MPKNLINIGVTSPGGFGLNTQTSGGILPAGWATVAENIVFDDKGRFSARKGTQKTTSSGAASAFMSLHEYVDAGGNTLIIGAADDKIYKLAGGSLTDISGTITTPTADNWKFQNFNGKCVGYQDGHAPIEISTVSGSFVDAGGTQYNGSDVLAAYGRLWTIYNNTLYYSDLLINSYAGGSSGSFDLATYWKGGMDEAVAIADFNGYLVVFGKRNIVIYSNPDDPVSSMTIVENISGIGCIARDSVQNTGEDIIFLSADGVRSLSRVIQEKSLPIGDLSQHNQDYILGYVADETKDDIKSVHCKCGNFYLLSLPTSGKTFYFDMRGRMQDGSARTTEWGLSPTSMLSLVDGTLYLAVDSGYISTYTGYLDGVALDGSGGSAYTLLYEGAWNDGGQEVGDLLKIPKKLRYNILGGEGQTVVLKWAFDYQEVFSTHLIGIPVSQGSEWGIAEYNIGEWSGTKVFNDANAPMNKTGQVIKIGFQSEINGEAIAIQRIDLQVKVGRIGI